VAVAVAAGDAWIRGGRRRGRLVPGRVPLSHVRGLTPEHASESFLLHGVNVL